MTLDFQKVHEKIIDIGKNIQQRKKVLDDRRVKARELLVRYADELDFLRTKVETVKAVDPALRCAIPQKEKLISNFPLPELPLPLNATLIAADGSQIVPSRHKPILYWLINVGVIAMEMGSGKAPEIFVETDLHYGDDDENEIPTESQVALRRDLAERKAMLEICKKYSGDIVTLTDGQLELWGSSDTENLGEFEKSLQDYLNALRAFREKDIVTAGYIDKPSANWFIRLLEISEISGTDIQNIRKFRPLRGVTDEWLFSEILGKHERSAVFAFQAKTAEKYKNDISLHFFYINVGDKDYPTIARVDIPRWVAQNEDKLNVLHKALIEQSRIMSHRPTPYILHRAHEIAKVSGQENEQVDQMIMLELRKNGGEMGKISGKQSAKDLPGKSSYRN